MRCAGRVVRQIFRLGGGREPCAPAAASRARAERDTAASAPVQTDKVEARYRRGREDALSANRHVANHEPRRSGGGRGGRRKRGEKGGCEDLHGRGGRS